MKPKYHDGRVKSLRAFDQRVGLAVSHIWMELRKKGVSSDCLGLIPALTFRLNQALQPLNHSSSSALRAHVLSEAAQAARETLIALGVKEMPMINLDRCISRAFDSSC